MHLTRMCIAFHGSSLELTKLIGVDLINSQERGFVVAGRWCAYLVEEVSGGRQ